MALRSEEGTLKAGRIRLSWVLMTKPRMTVALERDKGTCGTQVRLLFKCDWQDQSRRCRLRNTGCKGEIGSCPVSHEHWHRLKAPQVLRATEIGSGTDFLRKTLKAKIVITPSLFLCAQPNLSHVPQRKRARGQTRLFIPSFN